MEWTPDGRLRHPSFLGRALRQARARGRARGAAALDRSSGRARAGVRSVRRHVPPARRSQACARARREDVPRPAIDPRRRGVCSWGGPGGGSYRQVPGPSALWEVAIFASGPEYPCRAAAGAVGGPGSTIAALRARVLRTRPEWRRTRVEPDSSAIQRSVAPARALLPSRGIRRPAKVPLGARGRHADRALEVQSGRAIRLSLCPFDPMRRSGVMRGSTDRWPSTK